jgi:putative tryptophan/tyrosine transport system substrate-binding protein
MNRRAFVAGLGAVLAAPDIGNAQMAAKKARVGFLLMGSPEQAGLTPAFDAFRDGLRELGWIDNENIAIEYRWAGERPQRLPELAAELIRLKVDIIIGSTPGVRAAQHATTNTPIIMCIADDAVREGFVANLSRPGGNITGMASFGPELAGKRLGLLREATPRVTRVALLWNPPGAGPDYMKDTLIAARSLGVTLQSVEVKTANDFESAFASVLQGRAEALVVGSGQFMFAHQQRLVAFATNNRLPSIYAWKEPVSAGGLMAYGVNIPEVYRRAAYFVDKILRGTKPGDLPVERPTKFDLVVNLKTAKALGLTIPPLLLARADQVIE